MKCLSSIYFQFGLLNLFQSDYKAPHKCPHNFHVETCVLSGIFTYDVKWQLWYLVYVGEKSGTSCLALKHFFGLIQTHSLCSVLTSDLMYSFSELLLFSFGQSQWSHWACVLYNVVLQLTHTCSSIHFDFFFVYFPHWSNAFPLEYSDNAQMVFDRYVLEVISRE